MNVDNKVVEKIAMLERQKYDHNFIISGSLLTSSLYTCRCFFYIVVVLFRHGDSCEFVKLL